MKHPERQNLRPHRRQAHFWVSFNVWFRDLENASGRQTALDSVRSWYQEHAHLCWPDPQVRPSLKEARVHAKNLKPVEECRLRAAAYRAKLKAGSVTSRSRQFQGAARSGLPHGSPTSAAASHRHRAAAAAGGHDSWDDHDECEEEEGDGEEALHTGMEVDGSHDHDDEDEDMGEESEGEEEPPQGAKGRAPKDGGSRRKGSEDNSPRHHKQQEVQFTVPSKALQDTHPEATSDSPRVGGVVGAGSPRAGAWVGGSSAHAPATPSLLLTQSSSLRHKPTLPPPPLHPSAPSAFLAALPSLPTSPSGLLHSLGGGLPAGFSTFSAGSPRLPAAGHSTSLPAAGMDMGLGGVWADGARTPLTLTAGATAGAADVPGPPAALLSDPLAALAPSLGIDPATGLPLSLASSGSLGAAGLSHRTISTAVGLTPAAGGGSGPTVLTTSGSEGGLLYPQLLTHSSLPTGHHPSHPAAVPVSPPLRFLSSPSAFAAPGTHASPTSPPSCSRAQLLSLPPLQQHQHQPGEPGPASPRRVMHVIHQPVKRPHALKDTSQQRGSPSLGVTTGGLLGSPRLAVGGPQSPTPSFLQQLQNLGGAGLGPSCVAQEQPLLGSGLGSPRQYPGPLKQYRAGSSTCEDVHPHQQPCDSPRSRLQRRGSPAAAAGEGDDALLRSPKRPRILAASPEAKPYPRQQLGGGKGRGAAAGQTDTCGPRRGPSSSALAFLAQVAEEQGTEGVEGHEPLDQMAVQREEEEVAKQRQASDGVSAGDHRGPDTGRQASGQSETGALVTGCKDGATHSHLAATDLVAYLSMPGAAAGYGQVPDAVLPSSSKVYNSPPHPVPNPALDTHLPSPAAAAFAAAMTAAASAIAAATNNGAPAPGLATADPLHGMLSSLAAAAASPYCPSAFATDTLPATLAAIAAAAQAQAQAQQAAAIQYLATGYLQAAAAAVSGASSSPPSGAAPGALQLPPNAGLGGAQVQQQQQAAGASSSSSHPGNERISSSSGSGSGCGRSDADPAACDAGYRTVVTTQAPGGLPVPPAASMPPSLGMLANDTPLLLPPAPPLSLGAHGFTACNPAGVATAPAAPVPYSLLHSLNQALSNSPATLLSQLLGPSAATAGSAPTPADIAALVTHLHHQSQQPQQASVEGSRSSSCALNPAMVGPVTAAAQQPPAGGAVPPPTPGGFVLWNSHAAKKPVQEVTGQVPGESLGGLMGPVTAPVSSTSTSSYQAAVGNV